MSQANSLKRMMLDLINAERAALGLGLLELDLSLNDAAEDYSVTMLEQD